MGPEIIRIKDVPAILSRASHEDLVRDIPSDLVAFGTSDRITEARDNSWRLWLVTDQSEQITI